MDEGKKWFSFEKPFLTVYFRAPLSNDNVSKPRVLNPNKLFTLEKDATPVEPNDNSYYKDDLKDFGAYLRTVLGYGNYWLILDEIDKVESHDKDKFAPFSMLQLDGKSTKYCK